MKKILTIFVLSLSTALCVKAQSGFDKKIARAVKQLSCAEPGPEEPVTLNAGILSEKDSLAVMVKVRLAPGWHIYQHVPSTLPYIPIEYILKLPENFRASGKWEMSKAFPSSNDPGVLIYEKEAWFVHKALRLSDNPDVVYTGLYYQTCDLNQCLPPVEKTFDLKVSPSK